MGHIFLSYDCNSSLGERSKNIQTISARFSYQMYLLLMFHWIACKQHRLENRNIFCSQSTCRVITSADILFLLSCNRFWTRQSSKLPNIICYKSKLRRFTSSIMWKRNIYFLTFKYRIYVCMYVCMAVFLINTF